MRRFLLGLALLTMAVPAVAQANQGESAVGEYTLADAFEMYVGLLLR